MRACACRFLMHRVAAFTALSARGGGSSALIGGGVCDGATAAVAVRPLLIELVARRGCGGASSSSSLTEAAVLQEFSEAREVIEEAKESQGTRYFAEDLEEAIAQVKKTNEAFAAFVASLGAEERAAFLRANELKFKQLDAELDQLLHADD